MAVEIGRGGLSSVGSASQQAGAIFKTPTGSRGSFSSGSGGQTSGGAKAQAIREATAQREEIARQEVARQDNIRQEQERARQDAEQRKREELVSTRNQRVAQAEKEARDIGVLPGVGVRNAVIAREERAIRKAGQEAVVGVGATGTFTKSKKQESTSSIKVRERGKPRVDIVGGIGKGITKLEGVRLESRTQRATGKTSIPTELKAFGAGAGISALSIPLFAKSLLTKPQETITSIPGGVATFVKDVPRQAREEPSFLLGGFALDIVGSKGVGKVSRIGSKGSKLRKATSKLEVATPDISIGLSKIGGGGTKVILGTERRAGGFTSKTLQTFDVTDGTIRGGKGTTAILQGDDVLRKAQEFSFSGEKIPTVEGSIIRKVGDVTTKVPTGTTKVIAGKGIILPVIETQRGLFRSKSSRVSRQKLPPQPKFKRTDVKFGGLVKQDKGVTKFISGEIERTAKIRTTGDKISLKEIIAKGDSIKATKFKRTAETRFTPKGVGVIKNIEIKGSGFYGGGRSGLVLENTKVVRGVVGALETERAIIKSLGTVPSGRIIPVALPKAIKQPSTQTISLPTQQRVGTLQKDVSITSPVVVKDVTQKQKDIVSVTSVSKSGSRGRSGTRTLPKSITVSDTIQKNDIVSITKPIQKGKGSSITKPVAFGFPILPPPTKTTSAILPPLIIPRASLPRTRRESFGVQVLGGRGFRGVGSFGSISGAVRRGSRVSLGTSAKGFRVTGVGRLPGVVKGFTKKKTAKGIVFIEKKKKKTKRGRG